MPHNDLSAVLAPVSSARGLPNDHYVSDETYAAEREKVMFANWAGIGFAKDVPNAGDVMPVDFMGVPLLLVRDGEGEVNVYENICRHRGMILVEEKKNIGSGVIRCAYHSWCYSQKGKLVTTPHVGGPGQNTDPHIDRGTLGLNRVRSHVWRDVIFVNISGTAPEFTDYAAEAIALWADFEGKPLYHGGADCSFEFDVACNWKLAVENYCESYHLPWIHPGLNSYSRLEDHYHIEEPGKFSGQGTLVYRPTLGDGGQRFPDFDGLPEKWDSGAEYIALYPNVLFAAHRDHAYAMILHPKGKDRTIEQTELYYAKPEAAGPEFANLRETNKVLWKGVLEEDVFVVEGMQRGRHAPNFDGGKFSPVMDSPTHCFHHWVASQFEAGKIAAE